MSSSLPSELDGAPPRERHVFRALRERDGWVDTQTLIEETGYSSDTVQRAAGDLCVYGLAEWRKKPSDLRVCQYKYTR